jgi:serpin B
VNQKTALVLNEQGTQAAAVTEIQLVATSGGDEPQPVYFKLNRPFAFLIKENSTGAILFAGAINKL